VPRTGGVSTTTRECAKPVSRNALYLVAVACALAAALPATASGVGVDVGINRLPNGSWLATWISKESHSEQRQANRLKA
jgi:hypothetical protein